MRRRSRRASRKDGTYLSPAQESDTARPLGRIFLSFPCACLARARNPEFRWRTWERIGILRAHNHPGEHRWKEILRWSLRMTDRAPPFSVILNGGCRSEESLTTSARSVTQSPRVQGEGKRRGGCCLFCNRRDARVRAASAAAHLRSRGVCQPLREVCETKNVAVSRLIPLRRKPAQGTGAAASRPAASS